MPTARSSTLKLSNRNCPYLKKPSIPRFATTDNSIQARRAAGRSARTSPLAAHQSTTVDIQSRITNGGFHAA